MINPTTRSIQSRRRPLSASPVQPLLDLLLAALPLLVIGFIGPWLGPGTAISPIPNAPLDTNRTPVLYYSQYQKSHINRASH